MDKLFFAAGFLAFITAFSSAAFADAGDARSEGMGGTTIGFSNGAFAPLRNPAGMSDLEHGAFILPLSPVIRLDNNYGGIKPLIPSGSFEPFKYTGQLSDAFLKAGTISRTEINAVLPVFGYSGKPFPALSIMGKPLAFGINLWTRGNFLVKTDDDFNRLLGSGISMLNITRDLSSQADNLSKSVNSLASASLDVPTQSLATLDSEASIQESAGFQNNTLKPLIESIDNTVKLFGNVNQSLTGLLSDLEKLSDKNPGAVVVADGHEVIAVSGASRVFANDFIDISVGANLKGFFFAANPSFNPVNSAIYGTGRPNDKLFPLTIKPSLELGSFKSVSDLKLALDRVLNPLQLNSQKLLDNARKLDTQLSGALVKARQGADVVQPDLPQLQESSIALLLAYNSVSSLSGTGGSNVKDQLDQVKSSLVNDLNNIKFSYTQVTDVAPIGLGLDLGAQVKLLNNALLFGVVVENPLVFWPAKSRQTNVTFDGSQVFASGKPDLSKLLKPVEAKDAQTINYTVSEPLALRFGGALKFDPFHPLLRNLTLAADIEQVFNGRPFAVHLGLEKGWVFGNKTVYARAGGQIGGLGNMVTLGLGARIGSFLLELGYGASNPFNPLGSNSGVLALSTSLSY